MDHYDVYQVGGRLWSLRKLLKSDDALRRLAGQYQALDRLVSTVALTRLSRDDESPAAEPDADSAFLARILLGILQRGHSSFVSPYVESGILSGQIASPEPLDTTEVDHILDTGDQSAEDFTRRVLANLASVETGSHPDWSGVAESDAERAFFDGALRELLGPGLALVEAQRPLATMVTSESDIHRFVGQRVDFALETPSGTKLVFEIDGSSHIQASQTRLDRQRDAALQRAGWIVARVPADLAFTRHMVFDDHIRERVERDQDLASTRSHRGVDRSGNAQPDLAFRAAIAPHAVSRIHLAVLLAMMTGDLSLKAPRWSLGIVERDLPCAELAVVDLMQRIRQLATIYGIDVKTSVHLVIIPAFDANESPLPHGSTFGSIVARYARPSAIYRETKLLDLLIDVSVRSRVADRRVNEPLPRHHLMGLTTLYELRSAYRRAPEAFQPWPAPRPVPDTEAIEQPLRYFLQVLFRKPDFLEKQLDVLKRAFARKDVLGLLPTGGGKSLTFQLATLLSPGVTVVVAPLKSLIDDQVDNLHRAGVNRVASIHSGMDAKRKERALQDIVSGYPRFIYVSPERFHSKPFREELSASPLRESLAFAVIDEAHCVSEWGHDFRPAYLSVSHQARSLFRSAASPPPIIALTATASSTVLTDILRELQFDLDDKEALVSVPSFDRTELKFLPLIGAPETKQQDLARAIGMIASERGLSGQDFFDDPANAGVIFCRYVNGEFGVVGVDAYLKRTGIIGDDQLRFYAGGQPRKWSGAITWEDHKKRVQSDFKDDRFSALVATSSFGMGIDKRNIRYTVHYGIPQSLEALAQEAGRAGRDKRDAVCAIVYTPEQITPDTDYLAPDIDINTAMERYRKIRKKEQGDASRLMFLHGISYPGVEAEVDGLNRTFQEIVSAWEERATRVSERTVVILRRPWSDSESKRVDKALYRLSVLGVIEDYTIDYRAGIAEAETVHITPRQMEERLSTFIRRYSPEDNARQKLMAARSSREPDGPYGHVLRALCEFTYEVIEKARRESIGRVVQYLGRSGTDGETFSEELNRYLSQNTFTGRIAELVAQADANEWFAVLSDAHNHELAIQLVNATERELEANPTHAGLHILAGLGNLLRDTIPARAIAQRLIAGLGYYQNSFGKSAEERLDLARRIMSHIAEIRNDRMDSIASVLVDEVADDYVAMAAYPYVSSPDLKRTCAVPWLRHARDTARSLRGTTMEMSR